MLRFCAESSKFELSDDLLNEMWNIGRAQRLRRGQNVLEKGENAQCESGNDHHHYHNLVKREINCCVCVCEHSDKVNFIETLR